MKLSKGFIFTFLAALSWAVSIILARIILKNGENAYNVAFLTTIIASPYWFFVFTQNRTELKTISKKDFWILLGMALVSTVAVSIVEVFALKYSPAVNYSFLIRSTILFTILFAYLFLGEKLTRRKIVLAALILTGCYFLTTKGQIIFLSLGDIFTLTEAGLLAFGNNILGKIATNRMSVGLSSSVSFLFGVIPIGMIAFFNKAISLPKFPLLILFLTIFYILTTHFRFRAYRNATASYITMVFSFTPVFVSLLAIPFLKETMTPIQIFGGFLIILAGVFVEKFKI